MKKLTLLTLTALMMVGCEYQEPETRFGNGANEIFVTTVRGYDYVIFDGYSKGGIVHAASCPYETTKEDKDGNKSNNPR